MNTNDNGGEGLKPGDEGYVDPNLGGDNGDNGDEGAGDDKGAKETPQERYARLQGQLKRAAKDAGIEYEDPAPKKTSKKSEEKDYGQLAFLRAEGIKEADEIALAKDFMKNTGKDLDEVVGSKFFQAELKGLRDDRAAAEAAPKSGQRGSNSAQDTVEYWLNKGELPPIGNPKLRQDVVNARIKKESNTNIFSSNPVVRNG